MYREGPPMNPSDLEIEESELETNKDRDDGTIGESEVKTTAVDQKDTEAETSTPIEPVVFDDSNSEIARGTENHSQDSTISGLAHAGTPTPMSHNGEGLTTPAVDLVREAANEVNIIGDATGSNN